MGFRQAIYPVFNWRHPLDVFRSWRFIRHMRKHDPGLYEYLASGAYMGELARRERPVRDD